MAKQTNLQEFIFTKIKFQGSSCSSLVENGNPSNTSMSPSKDCPQAQEKCYEFEWFKYQQCVLRGERNGL